MGAALNIEDFARLVGSRWLIVCVTIAVAVAGAVALTLLTTPLYQATTRLVVSTTTGASSTDLYEVNLFSQQRVASYTKLLMGTTLAQRTVDRLNLDMSAGELQAKIKASSPPNTVLIDLTVLDESPSRARDIADALTDEFVVMVREFETPQKGARPTPDARVIVEQRAAIPAKPVIPKTTRNLTIGITLGVLFGIGLATLRDRLDHTVKSRETLEEFTGTGLVANIPFDKKRRKVRDISFASDRSAIAEAFRELRTNLQFLEVDNAPRVLVVTSSLPGEGKTTTAMNLALVLAESGHNVVLVDGDMRRPSLHSYLDLVGSAGFSTVLTGRASLSEALQKTRFPGVTVLTSGAIPPNPSELLGSLAAEKVLSEMRAQFDYVIVDSSALLAVTDAAILAARSDGVLVVARYAKTKREQLADAIGKLKTVGARTLGAVFTMTPTRGSRSRRFSYHGDVDTSPSSSPATSTRSKRVETSRSGRRPRHRRDASPQIQ
jgi:receptor protein-tyrosine kinase